ncbi:MAG: hypothetical protein HND46_01635 [Chloroflexi bacterium]|nr:hypothetical protein [Chloroflexota bacterium]NOG62094.1 hypothetical protein [Chloroflexota bacterium]
MSEIEKDPTQEQVAEGNPPASNPPQVIVQQAVIKGSMLGGVLLVLFVIGAILVYLLTGVVGWDNDSIQIISAMCVGPLLGLVVFGAWVLIQRGKSAHG